MSNPQASTEKRIMDVVAEKIDERSLFLTRELSEKQRRLTKEDDFQAHMIRSLNHKYMKRFTFAFKKDSKDLELVISDAKRGAAAASLGEPAPKKIKSEGAPKGIKSEGAPKKIKSEGAPKGMKSEGAPKGMKRSGLDNRPL